MNDVLLEAARAAREHAYAPYSGFRVGAAVVTADGRVFSGCNVENASYGLTICAERAAICSAVRSGADRLVAVVVVADGAHPVAPCGACRQVLAEFGADMEVRSVGEGGEATWRLTDLLPAAFRGDDLPKTRRRED